MLASTWCHAVYNPMSCSVESPQISLMAKPATVISFRLEPFDSFAHYADARGDYENSAHLYYCESCYAACGKKEAVFHTGLAPLKSMKNGPTDKQRAQMSEHADQHSIIWSWARNQEKKS